MSDRPRVLDLFCGAGGASVGYERAGFDVTGVDLAPQPRYPFDFVHHDALTVPLDGFDLIHASPPCQHYSAGAKQWGREDDHPDLIDAIRNRLIASGTHYIIENIATARAWLRDPILLCGQSFGLGVFRHRLFESSLPLIAPEHPTHDGKVGDGRYFTVTGHAGGTHTRDGIIGGTTAQWRAAMGVDWMTGKELVESIPPAYTHFLGSQVFAHLIDPHRHGAILREMHAAAKA